MSAFPLLGLLLASRAFALTPPEEIASFKTIQRNEVLAYRDAHLDSWLKRVEPGGQRLFYDELDWDLFPCPLLGST